MFVWSFPQSHDAPSRWCCVSEPAAAEADAGLETKRAPLKPGTTKKSTTLYLKSTKGLQRSVRI